MNLRALINYTLIPGLNSILKKLTGRIIVREKSMMDFVVHQYDSYEDYVSIQVEANIRKIDKVWADPETLTHIALIIESVFEYEPIKGLCHGSRNGFETSFFNERNGRYRVLGTDISETAHQFENSVQWDFHEEKTEWNQAHQFIYSNSLDQSWNPKEAVRVWLNQLTENGILFIEHSVVHGPAYTSKMDPFGVRPSAMPYVLAHWFGHQISVRHHTVQKSNMDRKAFIFELKRLVDYVHPDGVNNDPLENYIDVR